jgi:glycosyltransferase involved in cell wall biosynthesis
LFPYRLLRFFYRKHIFKKQLIKTVKTFNPDIIHTNVGVLHTGHYVAKEMKIPHVWHVREYQDLNFGWKPYPNKDKYLRLLSDKNNYPVAITRGVYEHHLLDRNKNSQVIYDGVFDADKIPEIKTQKKEYFLFVGLVSEGKGTDEAIKGFLSVAYELTDYELWIAGSGSVQYIEKLKKISIASGFGNKIKYLGHRTDVYQLMTEATALIVSSKFEGFGFITAEAMLNGCLVIGRNSAGTKEQFDNGRKLHGEEIGFRYNTTSELSMVLEEIGKKGAESYLSMIKKAQETAVSLYSSHLNAEKLYELYKNTLIEYGR